MQPSNFDELTKALATSTSRRQALRTILGASIGGLLGLGGISTAFGRHHRRTTDCNRPGGQKGNSNCAKWCHAVFGPNTPAAGQCTSDAAHGGGLCRQCGNVDPSSICCNRNGSGYCDGTVAGATCCPTGQHCQNGDCIPNCTGAGETCSVGTDCCSGSCCGGTCCDSGNCCNGTCCGSDESCFGFGGCCQTTQLCNAGSTCCDPASTCFPAGGGAGSFCCPTFLLCNNGSLCCGFANPCCGGTTCCAAGHCNNGVCS